MSDWLKNEVEYLSQLSVPAAAFSALVVATGGLLILLGFVGFALQANARRPDSQIGAPPRHRFLAVMSALCLSVGALLLLVLGVMLPLFFARLDLRRHLDRHLNMVATIESEQLTLTLMSHKKYQDPKRLNPYQFKIFSQHGEDGIIAEIFRRIGTTNRSFVEFGASDGRENNTAYLLRTGGWGGLWIDADTEALNLARSNFRNEIAEGRLTVTEALITAENIEDLFKQGKVPAEPDLLSIDIDHNDYHVWNKIINYRPRCVVIEYNGSFAPTISWVVPYDPKAWGNTGFGCGNGASLKALEELGHKKGYSLVNCEMAGVNAFFVRDDLLKDHFAAPFTAENHYEPFRKAQLESYYFANDLPGLRIETGAR
jgi:hypothetical protein